jgi:DNA-binding SARP family transcriptional activator/tetratricopeptide (TPR) repeat protein
MKVEFRLLGGVDVCVGGRPVDVGYARLRSVLAVLLIEANRTVSVDQLVDRVWENRRLPARPRGAVQHSMTKLRQSLADVPGLVIARQRTGYQVEVAPETVDVHRFRELVGHASTAENEERAVTLFESAFQLWRGEPCAGMDTPWFTTFRASLVEQRHAAQLDFNDVLLSRGRHTEVLTELSDQVKLNLFDERLAAQYMRALYIGGRQSEALAHYLYVRGELAEQLGTDPSPPLQQLYQQILTADPVLSGQPVVELRRPPVPRQLPAPPRLFTGRATELGQLTAMLDEPGGTMAISAVGGAGGVGKTSLALHWAHRNLDRFPDGQLHVNLRGFDPAGAPVTPQAAIRGFLDAFGIAAAAAPEGLEAQMGLYRSLVAGRRMLVMLDNAADADQVAPLLPGSPTCTVLVTSRRRLSGLITAHGAMAIELETLPDDAARDLLAHVISKDRIAAEPDAVTELVNYCAGLPLALSILAARANRHSGFPLAALAEEFRDRSGRLDALDAGDVTTNLRAVLSWSRRCLSPIASVALGLLGLVPCPSVSLLAVASLIDLPTARTRAVMRELEDAYLVHQHAPGRYRMHDLVRLYAADIEVLGGVTKALRRLVDHYLHSAAAAERLLDPPPRPPIEIEEAASGCHPYPLTGQADALAWLDDEHANLLAAQRLALEQGWYVPVWQLAWTMDIYHYRRGRLLDAGTMWQVALAAAEHLDDGVTQTLAHRRIGYACSMAGNHPEAFEHLEQALALTERAGGLSGQAHNHYILARAWEQQGNHRRALDHATQALRLYRSLGKPAREARALGAVSAYRARLGDHTQARAQAEAALTLFRQHGDRDGQGSTLLVLGQIAHNTGDHGHAIARYQEALEVFRELGTTYHEAETLGRLGDTRLAAGQVGQARAAWQRAVELYQVRQHNKEAERIRRKLAEEGAHGGTRDRIR